MVSVDQQKCIGCGACVALVPSCFEMGKNGKASVKKGCKCGPECKEAEDACPAGAISA